MKLLSKIAATAWFTLAVAIGAAASSSVSDPLDENDRRLQSNPAFLPDNGLIVMQAESVPITSPWKFETGVPGWTGKGFLRFDGNEPWGGPPNGELKYFFQIDTPGEYRLVMRLRSEGRNEENDCYIRVAGQASYLGEVRKAYIPGRVSLGRWRWHTQLEINHDAGFFPEPIYTFNKAGTYELQVWGRSRHLYFDRMILYKTDSVTFEYAKDLARPESRRVGDVAPSPPVAAPVPRPVPVPAPVAAVPVRAPVVAAQPVAVPVRAPTPVAVAAPVSTGTTTTASVTALIMVDANGKELHRFVRGIDNDFTVTRDTVKFADIGTKEVTIKVETVGAIDHVKFFFNNKVYPATFPPYAMQGSTGGVFATVPWLSTAGDKSIRATVYGPRNVVLSSTKLRFIMA